MVRAGARVRDAAPTAPPRHRPSRSADHGPERDHLGETAPVRHKDRVGRDGQDAVGGKWWHNLLGVWSVHVADIVDGRLVNERSCTDRPRVCGDLRLAGQRHDHVRVRLRRAGVNSVGGSLVRRSAVDNTDTLEGQPTRVSPPFHVKEWSWATWAWSTGPQEPLSRVHAHYRWVALLLRCGRSST